MAISNVGSSSYDTAAQVQSATQSKEAKTSTSEAAVSASTAEDVGVVYEPSKDAGAVSSKKSTKANTEVIAQLKADADARLSQLKGIVEQLISKQGKAAENASIWDQFMKSGEDGNFWSNLRKGLQDGSIQVDEATAKQAQADIAEDGYWGVQQTSARILDFAKALTGGDSSKVEEMRAAIQKGFDQAAKMWGDKLPDISQRTHEAVMKGLDEWAKEGK